ncbi:paeninodin family lasso peptide [Paenibacillus sp. FSL R7-0297]|nr:paeninodin family lasso peptide [Paenibacillus sp. FSL R5-0912]AIQ39329.1 recombinase RecA [Paenibacillus sp. FSL R5-0912]
MKKEYSKPALEVLDVKMTMAGPGIAIADSFQSDPEEIVNHS